MKGKVKKDRHAMMMHYLIFRPTAHQLALYYNIGLGTAKRIINEAIDYAKKMPIHIEIAKFGGIQEMEIDGMDYKWDPERDVNWSNYKSPNPDPLKLG